MLYRYETHCHTAEVSRCSRVRGADLVRYYHSLGYTGVFITDHFFNGNTTVPRTGLEWDERVTRFMTGYQNAKAEGDKLGLDVFFAWEYSYYGTDYLTYGLGEDWLREHPDCLEWDVKEYFDRVHQDGGFLVHAHPFRQQGYIKFICLFPDKYDAVEVQNASMKEEFNERATWYANSYGLLATSGSDMHNTGRPRLAGVDSPERLQSICDYGRLMKAGRLQNFMIFPDEMPKR